MTIAVEGDVLRLAGVLTMDTAANAEFQGGAAITAGSITKVDFGAVTHLDSSAIALIFSLQRLARAKQRELTFLNLPSSLQSLAAVYGVDDLLPQA
jgi:phospholipid transport system transporter-binding protein